MTTPTPSLPFPDFPGSVGLSHLTVYPWPTADDEHGGSPHIHLACTEAYVVTGGRGRLQTLNHEGPSLRTLNPGDVVWFTPGTIHRAVNDGDLQVLVVMQNGGLPEAGDAVLTFPPHHLTPQAYARAASLLDEDGRASQEQARARRDLALEGFAELQRAWQLGDHGALDAFYRAAAALVRPRLDVWETTVHEEAEAAANRTLSQIDALRTLDVSHLSQATVNRIAKPAERTLGMCGFLHAYDPVRRAGKAPP